MPWYLHLAIKQLFPTGKKLTLHSIFYILAILGVALGVMVLVISQSIMGGYGRIWREKILETNGHIRVQSREILYNVDEALAEIESTPGVAAAAPFTEGVVMLQNGNLPAIPVIRGIDIERTPSVIPLQKFLISVGDTASVDDLDDDRIFLSTMLAREIQVGVGSIIELTTPLALEMANKDELLLPRELEVAGLFETGWTQFDANAAIVSNDLMSELYNLGDGVHGISVLVEDGYDEHEVAVALNERIASKGTVNSFAFACSEIRGILLF